MSQVVGQLFGVLPVFDQLCHADWSVDAKKRWVASAERQNGAWRVDAPVLVGSTAAFLNHAFARGMDRRILLGFDFPIGVPAAYGAMTGFSRFTEMLPAVGDGAWARFFDVGERPEDVSVHRPFYPRSSPKGVSRASLVAGLRMGAFDDLLRICERRTEHRQAACSLFWTLGGNQVGKGALSGWKEIVRPALLRSARLWPFDGSLAELAREPGVTIAETYPAEAYRMVGAGFRPGQSKRRQEDRQEKAGALLTWANDHRVTFSPAAANALSDGFGASSNGEDRFDALLGLLKMIEVADGRRPEATERHPATGDWEGWILGR